MDRRVRLRWLPPIPWEWEMRYIDMEKKQPLWRLSLLEAFAGSSGINWADLTKHS